MRPARLCPRSPVLTALAVAALGAAPASAQERGAAQPQATIADVVRGNQAFALDLYARLRSGEGNLCLSPHSISIALAMTLAGARGGTAEEMANVLHLATDDPSVHAVFAELSRALQVEGADEPARLQLAIANRLWPDVRETVRPAYLELLDRHYAGGLEQLDFQAADAAAARINAWVAERTNERIPELVQPDDVFRAAFVLTNAIAFQGAWQLPFDPERTAQADFHAPSGRTLSVPMMSRRGEHAFARREGYQALELAFAGERFAMLFLLPDAVDGLEQLERSLAPRELEDCVAALGPAELTVGLPRFELRTRFELADVLVALGMKSAFSGSADFTGMFERPGVFLTRVIHEAFVRVDEEGAEAAAATAVIGKRGALPLEFRADHPFLFLIRDRETGSVLFLGRVVEP